MSDFKCAQSPDDSLFLFSCQDESIDEVAAYLGVGEQVAALTAKWGKVDVVNSNFYCTHVRRAMGGTVDFKTALSTRLGVMKPSKQDITTFLEKNPHKITPGDSERAITFSSSLISLGQGFRSL